MTDLRREDHMSRSLVWCFTGSRWCGPTLMSVCFGALVLVTDTGAKAYLGLLARKARESRRNSRPVPSLSAFAFCDSSDFLGCPAILHVVPLTRARAWLSAIALLVGRR